MLLVVMLIGMATALFVYGMVDTNTLAVRRDKVTAAAFANVKRALIGWSVQRTSSNVLEDARPGELPCPDMDNNGAEDGTCVAGAIGRVPWKTLGIPEPKDGEGESLWYTIAGPFRIRLVNNNPINSDTRGNLTVYRDSMASTITTEAVAVLFAPGAVRGTQNRNPVATALCPTTGTTIARNRCAENYLETVAGVNNASTNGPFISAPDSGTFNDRVMVITTADLMPVVEQRVAREVRTALQAYKTNSNCGCYPPKSGCGCYPWSDISDGTSETDENRGRVPIIAGPENWGSGTIPYLPGRDTGTNGWFVDNDWRLVIYYAIGKNFLEANSSGVRGGACVTCVNPTLSFNGTPGKEVVLIMPGPAGVSGAHTNWPFDYFEDGENSDNANDLYVSPSSTAYVRDRIYTIP